MYYILCKIWRKKYLNKEGFPPKKKKKNELTKNDKKSKFTD